MQLFKIRRSLIKKQLSENKNLPYLIVYFHPTGDNVEFFWPGQRIKTGLMKQNFSFLSEIPSFSGIVNMLGTSDSSVIFNAVKNFNVFSLIKYKRWWIINSTNSTFFLQKHKILQNTLHFLNHVNSLTAAPFSQIQLVYVHLLYLQKQKQKHANFVI